MMKRGRGSRFSDEQKDLIMRLHPVLSNKEIAEIMGCNVSTIEMFAYRNGMIKAKNEGIITPAKVERGRHHRYIVSQTPYWELVKQYKKETPIRRFNHPFYYPNQREGKFVRQFKEKQDGTD